MSDDIFEWELTRSEERATELEAQLAEAREENKRLRHDARVTAILYLRDCKRHGVGNVGHMKAALRLLEFNGDYVDWVKANKPVPVFMHGTLKEVSDE